MVLLEVACGLFLTPAALAAGYYLFLAGVALLARPTRSPQPGPPRHTFAIVVPAHDEEDGIAATLASCAALDYPAGMYRVFVVADNCSDRTAELAEQAGAVCLRRHDPEHKGKGHALAWAFAQVLPHRHDAVVVLDADCALDPGALRAFDAHLSQGRDVVQACPRASNPDQSVRSYLLAVGGLTESLLFYAPKSRLGSAVFLRGTGMAFRADILRRIPWQACSLAEDAEYTLRLLRAGVPVWFAEDVRLSTASPADAEQLRVQRTRWAAGGLGLARAHALRLIRDGLLQGRPLLADAGWTLLVLSRPLVLLQAVVALLLAGLCFGLQPGPGSAALLAVGLAVVLLHALYFGLGVLRLGLTRRRLGLLLRTPPVFCGLVAIALLGLWRSRASLTWARTTRSGPGVGTAAR